MWEHTISEEHKVCINNGAESAVGAKLNESCSNLSFIFITSSVSIMVIQYMQLRFQPAVLLWCKTAQQMMGLLEELRLNQTDQRRTF